MLAGFNTCPLNRIVQDVWQLGALPEGALSAAAVLATVGVRRQPATFVKSDVMAELSRLWPDLAAVFCVLQNEQSVRQPSPPASLMRRKLFPARLESLSALMSLWCTCLLLLTRCDITFLGKHLSVLTVGSTGEQICFAVVFQGCVPAHCWWWAEVKLEISVINHDPSATHD